VIAHPGSIGSLAVCVVRRRGVPVRLVDEIEAELAAVPAEATAGPGLREVAAELDRLADRRDRLRPRDRADIQQPPSGAGPDLDPGNQRQDRRTGPHRDR
jgi:hypothetical protein